MIGHFQFLHFTVSVLFCFEFMSRFDVILVTFSFIFLFFFFVKLQIEKLLRWQGIYIENPTLVYQILNFLLRFTPFLLQQAM